MNVALGQCGLVATVIRLFGIDILRYSNVYPIAYFIGPECLKKPRGPMDLFLSLHQSVSPFVCLSMSHLSQKLL